MTGMRVTSQGLRQAFLDTLQQAQQRLQQTQTQISTGKKVNQPSDDPLAASRIREIEASLARMDQYQSNALLAQNRLGIEEETLVGVVNGLQRIRELAVQANNATVSQGGRDAIAVELRQQFTNLLALANATDGQDRYLFAGYREQTQPFIQTVGSVTYSGDDGQHNVMVSDRRLLATGDPGSAVFERIRDGNGTFVLAADPANAGTGILGAGTVVDPALFVSDTYTIEFVTATDYEVRDSGAALVASGTYSAPQTLSFLGIQVELDGDPAVNDTFTVTPSGNQSLFETVSDLIAAIETPANTGAGRALLHNQVGQSLTDLDRALEHVIDVRGEVGARLRSVDSELALNEGFSVQLSETLSGIQDLDYAEAISSLSQQLFGLEASQQAYTRLQGLSLFRFL
ncbi:MAG: flagellar hook-associated protein FlgL [Gammaproteobacteria bacterium]|nr:flagellar hook-associated protein FlgL [Gammaproteobacteria bacterium]